VIEELDKLASRMTVPVRLIIIGGLGLINFRKRRKLTWFVLVGWIKILFPTQPTRTS
jgi:hypothetical protein